MFADLLVNTTNNDDSVEHAEKVTDNESSAKEDDDVSFEEEVLDKEEIKEQLLHALDNIDDYAAGTFAIVGDLPDAANPGLLVEGLGGVDTAAFGS
ncbi:hypothetical protein MMC13_003289 [Lambiella insularis]|nr:hypothetical protein [Lambiella insularis]